MCGIFGYAHYGQAVSRSAVLQTLVTGLRRLEYRGYDSAGLAVDGGAEGPAIIKAIGTVDKLETAVDAARKAGGPLVGDRIWLCHVGVAHTRWATHGAPSVINSHPHVSDARGTFVVVHNGIVTNFKALKEMLEAKGFVFESETDTEVIAKLLLYLFRTVREDGRALSFPRLVMHLMHALEGAYALLLRSSEFPNELVGCKVGSPLVLGLKPARGEVIAEAIEVIKGSIVRTGSGGARDPEAENASKRRKMGADALALPAEAQTSEGDVRKAEFYFSSDASAIVEHTDKVVYFEDNDLVHLGPDGKMSMFSFADSHNRAIVSNRAISTLDMELEQIMKGSYPHFMLKEINEQPETLQQTMRGRVLTRGADRPLGAPIAMASMADVHLGGLQERLGDIRRSSRIIFVACGTSFHACLAARQVMEELTELPVAIELASDFLDRETPLFRSDVCVFVSQSGETADTLAALRYSKKCQALTVGIVNVVGSSIARMTDTGVHLNAGAEIGVASTKVYTSQIIVMVIIALQLSIDSRAKQARRREIYEALVDLPKKVEETLSRLNEPMKALAERLSDNSSILLFGRGYQYATCLEGALKIKEVSYIHTEGIHAGELKHGPLALVDENMPVILFANRDACSTKVHNALHQVTARGGMSNMLIVGTIGDEEIAKFSDKAELVLVPETVDCLQCILSILPMQLLSYHLAVSRGLNVDQPRYVYCFSTLSLAWWR